MEIYEAILESLVKEPLTNDQIAYDTSIDCNSLEDRLDFLLQNGLVEDRVIGETILYAITERGATVLKTVSFNRYLAKVSQTLRALDDAIQVLPLLSNQKEQNETNRKDGKY